MKFFTYDMLQRFFKMLHTRHSKCSVHVPFFRNLEIRSEATPFLILNIYLCCISKILEQMFIFVLEFHFKCQKYKNSSYPPFIIFSLYHLKH